VGRTSIAFGTGVLTALALGWIAFPRMLYTRQAQPLQFRHKTHAAKSGGSGCADCHSLQEDGTFGGVPRLATCAGCHAGPMGSTEAEAALVTRFVKPGIETPWLVYSRQPANVRFSHAIHTVRGGLACAQCHGETGTTDVVKVYQQDRISGYSREIGGTRFGALGGPHGKRMSDCEDCHRERRVEVGCLGCHQ
jgi:hypothetical protein